MESSTALPADAMALGVSFDGRAYHYRHYSYDHLDDALNYAKLERSRPGFHEPSPLRWPQWTGPTSADRQQMAAYGVAYEDGHYRYGPYRYDLLAAALAYAKGDYAVRTNRPGPGEAPT
jgi:hypothetical protein